ncbi:Coenzyme F420 hydrogenase/dehydrogenase, beta subunit C-terminal domain [uncultured Algibacter sp.]|uniref:Coenzyme F420 hydrogenase/dehydrogenase, beta subunit C-terminal domain n=1 Tax=uncultured Algibacter sp. TaxID=298659 RepID=UPI0026043B38|nr:Coenzyme F420 hydrogenase/dehydrogenase, beta subunit C-terminal domain [uncultured Algibacter sp.]
MKWNDYGFLVPEQVSESLNNKAIQVCPFNPKPEFDVQDEDKMSNIFLKEAKYRDFRIGNYENIYVGYSKEYRKTSSSGGLATYIFEKLLIDNVVDHLYIVKEINGTYAYQFFSNGDQIKQISKTRYIPVTLEELFNNIDSIDGKIAVSGVACFLKAIRLKQHYNPHLIEKMPFLIGIICGGLKSSFFTDYLAQKSGIEEKYTKQEYRIKDEYSTASDYSFGALDGNNDFKKIKMRTVGDMWGTGLFKANACDFCDDVTTELADISLGDAWFKPYSQDGLGNSVIVTRTPFSDKIIQDGIKNKLLSVNPLDLKTFKSSQQGSFNHRQDGLKYRIQKMKKQKKLTPTKRSKFLKKTPFYFKSVQKQRMVVRSNSLKFWFETKDATKFESFLKPSKDKLQKLTLFYHRMRKLKRILLKENEKI